MEISPLQGHAVGCKVDLRKRFNTLDATSVGKCSMAQLVTAPRRSASPRLVAAFEPEGYLWIIYG